MGARLLFVAILVFSGVLHAGDAARLYFTPSARTEKILQAAIASAHRYVYVASYSFSWQEGSRTLAERRASGVDVRVLLDRPPGCVIPAGLARHLRLEQGTGLFHAKMIVVDDRFVIIPSANLTAEGLRRDHNSLLMIEDSVMAGFCRERFLAWWQGRRETSPFCGRSGELFFAPGPDCARRVREALAACRSRVRFLQYAFTAEDIAYAAARRSLAGCRVWGLMDPSMGSAVPAGALLADLGCEVRRSSRAGLLHDKMIIVDDRVVLTGSYNLSRAAERNVECLVVMDNPAVARSALREFCRLWRWWSLP